jgi:hypothetical protein
MNLLNKIPSRIAKETYDPRQIQRLKKRWKRDIRLPGEVASSPASPHAGSFFDAGRVIPKSDGWPEAKDQEHPHQTPLKGENLNSRTCERAETVMHHPPSTPTGWNMCRPVGAVRIGFTSVLRVYTRSYSHSTPPG